MSRVLILGGGFGGFYTALGLERRLSRGHDITLVSAENYLLYTPLLPQAAAGSLEPRHLVVPLRSALRRTRTVLGTVTAIDTVAQHVTVRPPAGLTFTLPYDQLVFALGSSTRMPHSVPGLVEHAVGFKDLAEAIWLRNRVLSHLELADAAGDPAERRALLTFVFVGGGYAGVEAAAELFDLARDAVRYYPSLSRRDIRVVVLEAASSILRDLGEDFAGRVQRHLSDKGIDIRPQTTLQEVRGDSAVLASGEAIPTRTVVWTAGVVANALTQVIPGDRDKKVTLEREPFFAAVRKVALMTTDKTRAVKLDFKKGKLSLFTRTQDVGEAHVEVPIDYRGEEFDAVFNPDYIIDYLKVVTDEKVELQMKDKTSAGVFKAGKDYVYVLMPLTVNL